MLRADVLGSVTPILARRGPRREIWRTGTRNGEGAIGNIPHALASARYYVFFGDCVGTPIYRRHGANGRFSTGSPNRQPP